jgi:hypothetical protein
MKKGMRLILDANEYIFGMDESSQKYHSKAIFRKVDELLETIPEFILFIPEIIRAEVQRNMPKTSLGDFYSFMFSNERIIYIQTYDVPDELIDKYQAEVGLKSEDALIAAFAEWQGVHFIVSDNRHFYEELKVEQFITCNAEEFLRLLTSGEIWQIIEQLETKR